MRKTSEKPVEQADPLLTALEKGITDVLSNAEATVKDKMAAIAAGVKVAAIKHKISGGDQGGFFD